MFDSFDFASSDVEETEQNLLAPPFDVRADNRLWLAPLLVQFGDEQIVSRVAWSAILLRFLVQQQHWSIDNATCVLLAINNRKRQHLSWNNHQVTQWIDSQPKLSSKTVFFSFFLFVENVCRIHYSVSQSRDCCSRLLFVGRAHSAEAFASEKVARPSSFAPQSVGTAAVATLGADAADTAHCGTDARVRCIRLDEQRLLSTVVDEQRRRRR